jgi:selenophosphate synthase
MFAQHSVGRKAAPCCRLPPLVAPNLCSVGLSEAWITLGVSTYFQLACGLCAGHLVEMVRPSHVAVAVSLPSLPLLPGAAAAVQAGYVSSLEASNRQAGGAIANLGEVANHPLFPLLLDPQTAGGLLASVPQGKAEECLQALHHAGYSKAAIIGRVRKANESGRALKWL